MDLNDINQRVKDIYTSIGLTSEDLTGEHLKVVRLPGNILAFSFDGKSLEDVPVKIMSVVGSISAIKDIIKNKSADPKLIEAEIATSLPLQIVLDLTNAYKHGYPAKQKHSKKDPKIINETRQSVMQKGGGYESNITRQIVGFDPDKMQLEIREHGTITFRGVKVFITADIVDKDGNHLMSFDTLVNDSMAKWEEIIKKLGIK
jgi:hypothetical protein